MGKLKKKKGNSTVRNSQNRLCDNLKQKKNQMGRKLMIKWKEHDDQF